MVEEHTTFDIKYIQLITEFDGNANFHKSSRKSAMKEYFPRLEESINLVDKLILNSIQSKWRGGAAEVAELYGCLRNSVAALLPSKVPVD